MNAEKQTKDWIADSLLELLNHKDYHDITIGQIAENAHIGRRTFYHHFKTKLGSKDDLAAFSPEQLELFTYMLYFRLAGFWKLTTVWCSETPRKSPEVMSELMEKIVYEEKNSLF